MVEEACLERVESGLTPATPGWFVVNVRDAAWRAPAEAWAQLGVPGWRYERPDGWDDLPWA